MRFIDTLRVMFMSIVKTQSCKSSYTRLSYILSGMPHNTDKVSHRVLAVFGQNVNLLHDKNGNISNTQSGAYLERQFHQSLMKARNPKRTYQCQSIIISFSPKEFDTSDIKKQASQANKLAQLYVQRFFGDSQAISVVQADGAGGKIHVHILVNAVNRQGKTIQTNRFSIFHLRKQFDKFMEQNFEKITDRPWPGPSNQTNRLDSHSLTTKSEWQRHVKQVIKKVKSEVTTISEFLTKLSHQYGITVTNRSKNTAWTYHQQVKTAKGLKEYKVRDYYERRNKKTGEIKSIRGLGKDFTKASITEYLESKNKKEDISYGKRKSKSTNESEQSIEEVREQARIANLQLKQQREQQRRTIAKLNAFVSRQAKDVEAVEQHRKQTRQFSDQKRRRQIADAAKRNDAAIPIASGNHKSTNRNHRKHHEAEGPSI